MSKSLISDEAAFRVALAAKALPGISLIDLIAALQEQLGDAIDETGLSTITVERLKANLIETYKLNSKKEGNDVATLDLNSLKEAVRILWGEIGEPDTLLPTVEPYAEGDMLHSLRVAVASNSGEQLDGHFGSCLHYLIYQLSPQEIKLIDIRSAAGAEKAEEKSTFRVDLVRDCHVLYVVSVGGPAAAKVIQAGIYPMKKDEGGSAREVLAELQQVMATAPPPWMAKLLGVSSEKRFKDYAPTSS